VEKWIPIEKASRDRTRVLGCRLANDSEGAPYYTMEPRTIYAHGRSWYSWESNMWVNPSHFMPIPRPEVIDD
jgi:hypothetical protein